MKTPFDDNVPLPAFSLTRDQFISMIKAVEKQLPEDEYNRTSIEVEIKSKKIRFENLEEFLSYDKFPNKILKFSLSAHACGDMVLISNKGGFNHDFKLYVSGNDEDQCAAIKGVIINIIEKNKRWYSLFNSFPMLSFSCLFLAALILLPEIYIQNMVTQKLVFLWAFFALIHVFRDWFLPAGTLYIHEDLKFFEKYNTLIIQVLGVLTLAATIVGAYFAYLGL